MCGIVGYIGQRPAVPILVTGLKRLEYRGYDSAGLAVIEDGELRCLKAVGRIAALEDKLNGATPTATIGIAHTRWATHGPPTEVNAHPHFDCSGQIALVHNGISENYEALKARLGERGHTFRSVAARSKRSTAANRSPTATNTPRAPSGYGRASR